MRTAALLDAGSVLAYIPLERNQTRHFLYWQKIPGGGGRNDRCQTTIPGGDRRTNDTRRGSGTAIRHAGKQEAAARQRDRRQQGRTQRTPGNATTPAAGGDTTDDSTAAGQEYQQHGRGQHTSFTGKADTGDTGDADRRILPDIAPEQGRGAAIFTTLNKHTLIALQCRSLTGALPGNRQGEGPKNL